MDKKLALALDFAKAPKALKTAAETHRANLLRVEKAKTQLAKWNHELETARKAFLESGKIFDQEVMAWDPTESKKNQPIEIVDPSTEVQA